MCIEVGDHQFRIDARVCHVRAADQAGQELIGLEFPVCRIGSVAVTGSSLSSENPLIFRRPSGFSWIYAPWDRMGKMPLHSAHVRLTVADKCLPHVADSLQDGANRLPSTHYRLR